jgi:hypothetical protein
MRFGETMRRMGVSPTLQPAKGAIMPIPNFNRHFQLKRLRVYFDKDPMYYNAQKILGGQICQKLLQSQNPLNRMAAYLNQ